MVWFGWWRCSVGHCTSWKMRSIRFHSSNHSPCFLKMHKGPNSNLGTSGTKLFRSLCVNLFDWPHWRIYVSKCTSENIANGIAEDLGWLNFASNFHRSLIWVLVIYYHLGKLGHDPMRRLPALRKIKMDFFFQADWWFGSLSARMTWRMMLMKHWLLRPVIN